MRKKDDDLPAKEKAIMQCVRVAFGGANLTDEDEAIDQGYDPESRTMKDVSPKTEGTGLLTTLDNISLEGIDQPEDTQPDPDLIITEQADVVDPEPEKKPAKKAKTPSQKLKEMAEEKSLSDSRSDSVIESEIQPEMF